MRARRERASGSSRPAVGARTPSTAAAEERGPPSPRRRAPRRSHCRSRPQHRRARCAPPGRRAVARARRGPVRCSGADKRRAHALSGLRSAGRGRHVRPAKARRFSTAAAQGERRLRHVRCRSSSSDRVRRERAGAFGDAIRGAFGDAIRLASTSDSAASSPDGALPNSACAAASMPCSSPRKVTRLRYASRIWSLLQASLDQPRGAHLRGVSARASAACSRAASGTISARELHRDRAAAAPSPGPSATAMPRRASTASRCRDDSRTDGPRADDTGAQCGRYVLERAPTRRANAGNRRDSPR